MPDLEALMSTAEDLAIETASLPDFAHDNTLDEDIEPASENDEFDPEKWEATHMIGDTQVQCLHYSTGLAFYVQRDGRKRRPTEKAPLRPYYAKPEEARKLWLDREAVALALSVIYGVNERNEDAYGNIAFRINQDHIRLCLNDRFTKVQRIFIIQIPEELEVIGTEVK